MTSVYADTPPPRDVAIGLSLERVQRLVLHHLRPGALYLRQPGLQSRGADPHAKAGTHMSSSQLRKRNRNVYHTCVPVLLASE